MLHLKMATDPRWVNIAEKSIGDILIDHAFCEQKAATFCISLIVQYSDHPEIVEALSPIVSEEWGHFRKVLKELKLRRIPLGKQRKDEYVNLLMLEERKLSERNSRMVEKLLICALIEARSCERFRLLSLHISDESLRDFYHDFMVSEAGHYRLFMELAEKFMPKEYVRVRWEEFLVAEEKILNTIGLRADRIH